MQSLEKESVCVCLWWLLVRAGPLQGRLLSHAQKTTEIESVQPGRALFGPVSTGPFAPTGHGLEVRVVTGADRHALPAKGWATSREKDG